MLTRLGRLSLAAGCQSELAHFRSVKWTCAFQNPAITTQWSQGITLAPAGTATSGPTAAILPSCTTTVPRSIAGASGEV